MAEGLHNPHTHRQTLTIPTTFIPAKCRQKKEKKPKTNNALKLAHTLRLRRTNEAATEAEIGAEADLLSFRLRKVCVRLYRGSKIKPMRTSQVCHTLYVCKQELGLETLAHTHTHTHSHSHSSGRPS